MLLLDLCSEDVKWVVSCYGDIASGNVLRNQQLLLMINYCCCLLRFVWFVWSNWQKEQRSQRNCSCATKYGLGSSLYMYAFTYLLLVLELITDNKENNNPSICSICELLYEVNDGNKHSYNIWLVISYIDLLKYQAFEHYDNSILGELLD